MRRGGTKKKLQKKWNVKKCGKTKRGAEKCTDRVVWRYRKKYDVYAERHVPCRWSSGEPGAIARIKEDLSEAERADSFADKWAVLYLRDAPPMRSARSTPRSSLGFPLGFFLFLAFFVFFFTWSLLTYELPDTRRSFSSLSAGVRACAASERRGSNYSRGARYYFVNAPPPCCTS